MSIDKNIGKAGVVDENETFDIERSQVQPTQPGPNDVKVVGVKVPAVIPDEYILNAVNIGLNIMNLTTAGRLVMHFPSMGNHPKTGQPVPVLGKFEMIIAKQEDTGRMVALGRVINEENSKIAAAQSDPVNLLGTTLEGTKRKDEALRQLKQEAQGQVPLTLAKEAPPAASKGGIQIATR